MVCHVLTVKGAIELAGYMVMVQRLQRRQQFRIDPPNGCPSLAYPSTSLRRALQSLLRSYLTLEFCRPLRYE